MDAHNLFFHTCTQTYPLCTFTYLHSAYMSLLTCLRVTLGSLHTSESSAKCGRPLSCHKAAIQAKKMNMYLQSADVDGHRYLYKEFSMQKKNNTVSICRNKQKVSHQWSCFYHQCPGLKCTTQTTIATKQGLVKPNCQRIKFKHPPK